MSNTAEGTVGTASVVFTPSDWNQPRTITVTGVNDNVDDGDVAYSINVTATSGDATFNGKTATVGLTTIDDDTAGITVNPTSGLTTTEAAGAGATATFTSGSTRSRQRMIPLSTSDTTEGTRGERDLHAGQLEHANRDHHRRDALIDGTSLPIVTGLPRAGTSNTAASTPRMFR